MVDGPSAGRDPVIHRPVPAADHGGAFRSPTVFPTLVALLVGEDLPCATQADLDRVLTGLEDRGLLGWDRVSNRYDLHPMVRGVVWSSLDPDARRGIDLRLASHLGEALEVDYAAVTSVDDLSNTIELYYTLVRLGRLKDAVELSMTGSAIAWCASAAIGTRPSWLASSSRTQTGGRG